MADFETCPCGERPSAYCRACSTRKCRFCMIESHRCLPCRTSKRKREIETLHAKTKAAIAKLDVLTDKWDELGEELQFDPNLSDEAVIPFHHLQLAGKLLRKIYEE